MSSTSLPATMNAWRIRGFGPPDVLEPSVVEVRTPVADEVLVQVVYCGVCRHDLLTRSGAFPHVPLPLTLGHQVSGVVAASGPEARWAPGTRLMSLIFMGCGRCPSCREGNPAVCQTAPAKFMGDDFDGGYAEYVCAPSRAFLEVPPDLGLDVAAVVSCTLGTAYHAVHTRGGVAPDDTVVVTGASGGIGLHTLSVLRRAGARIVAITSRESKTDVLREHGADEVVADPDLRFARRVKDLTGGRGADVVIDIVGSPTLAQSLHAVRAGGRVVVVGNVSGTPAEVRPAHLIMKEIALLGTKSCTEAELTEVMRLVARGELDVDISHAVPLAEVRAAHATLDDHELEGRLLLQVGDDPARSAAGAAR